MPLRLSPVVTGRASSWFLFEDDETDDTRLLFPDRVVVKSRGLLPGLVQIGSDWVDRKLI